MVNQYQLLEFLKNDALDIYYSECPYFHGAWSKENVGAGFSPLEAQQLTSLTPYQGQPISGIYRIHTPNTLTSAPVKVITFLVTEFGLDDKCFVPGVDLQTIQAYGDAGNLIVTPSNWSRDRIVEYGFRPESVYVVPHAVDGNRFRAFAAEGRQRARATLGFRDEDVVFLNVGAPFWNKGMDILLEAFFITRQTHKNARLLIKDQQALYGMTAVKMIQGMVAEGRITIDEDSVNAISVIPKSLSMEQLCSLYGVADYYISPYRAEGFNLPVIEAIACGTKVIVTAGGSTDDFCDDGTSIKIPSSLKRDHEIYGHFVGASLEPDMDALVGIMSRCAMQLRQDDARIKFGRTDLLEKFTWKRAASLITALI